MTEEVVTPPVDTPEVPEVPVQTESEKQAVGYGWKPKEEWVADGGTEEDWVPAKHFLKFGEVKQQLISKDKQLNKQDKIIKMMKVHHLNVKQAAKDEAIAALRAEKAAALENNDLIQVEKIKDRIDVLKEAAAEGLPLEIEREERELRQVAPAIQPPPEFFTFLERNPWYTADQSRQDDMSREADMIGAVIVQKAQAEGQQLTYDQIYKAVEVRIRKMFPEKFSTPKSPQQDGGKKSSDKASTSSVKLNEEEAGVAKNFNLTPEQYVAQQKTYRGRA